MVALERVLVIGGGIAGMSCAIRLAEAGIATTLIDIDAQWRVYGAGITITGPTLRAMGELGILDRVIDEGHTADGVIVCSMAGEKLTTIETPPVLGRPGLGAGGILRPILHSILSDRVRALNVDVRLGVSTEALEQADEHVHVRFSDRTASNFSLVIGADGVFSKTRDLIFPNAPKPTFTGQACWRLMLARPPEIDRRHFFLGGPVKIGLTPVSKTEMYMFLLQLTSKDLRLVEDELPVALRSLMKGFGGVLAEIRERLGSDSRIIYRPLEGALLPRPWYSGRVVLVGDAVHATTPQLASGAGMSIEDALVLVDELSNAGELSLALRNYLERRFDRCRMVVENSLELGRLEMRGAPAIEQADLVQRSLEILAEAI